MSTEPLLSNIIPFARSGLRICHGFCCQKDLEVGANYCRLPGWNILVGIQFLQKYMNLKLEVYYQRFHMLAFVHMSFCTLMLPFSTPFVVIILDTRSQGFNAIFSYVLCVW